MCQDCLPSNFKEPTIQKPRQGRPFQEIAVDFCTYAGTDYLDWPAVIPMDYGITTPQLIRALCQSFCYTAIPDIVWSDGGPQFTSNMFYQFAQQWAFLHKVPRKNYPNIMEWEIS